MRNATTLVGALVVGLGACSPDAADAPRVSVRDSLGIEIVEIPSTLTELPGLQLSPQPLLSIGGAAEEAEEYLFDRITLGRRLADGRVLGGQRR